jgi:hypothetical protein
MNLLTFEKRPQAPPTRRQSFNTFYACSPDRKSVLDSPSPGVIASLINIASRYSGLAEGIHCKLSVGWFPVAASAVLPISGPLTCVRVIGTIFSFSAIPSAAAVAANEALLASL